MIIDRPRFRLQILSTREYFICFDEVWSERGNYNTTKFIDSAYTFHLSYATLAFSSFFCWGRGQGRGRGRGRQEKKRGALLIIMYKSRCLMAFLWDINVWTFFSFIQA